MALVSILSLIIHTGWLLCDVVFLVYTLLVAAVCLLLLLLLCRWWCSCWLMLPKRSVCCVVARVSVSLAMRTIISSSSRNMLEVKRISFSSRHRRQRTLCIVVLPQTTLILSFYLICWLSLRIRPVEIMLPSTISGSGRKRATRAWNKQANVWQEIAIYYLEMQWQVATTPPAASSKQFLKLFYTQFCCLINIACRSS